MFFREANSKVQKQPLETFHKRMCSKKFRKIYMETPGPESFFLMKVQVLGNLLYNFFLVFQSFLWNMESYSR